MTASRFLPPGCRESDVPGCGPYDDAQDDMICALERIAARPITEREMDLLDDYLDAIVNRESSPRQAAQELLDDERDRKMENE